ncbi:MAG: YbaK/EbsC family protein [Acetobacteraceae bacterium]
MEQAVARVREALLAHGHADTITAFPAGTRTAADAAAAIGCDVAQIAKSIVFRVGDQAVIAITSGASRVDRHRVGALLGLALSPAAPDFVRAATGFAPGGVSPVGLLGAPTLLLDRDLLTLDPLWAAAGSPMHVFETRAEALLAMTGATVADVRQEEPNPRLK